MGGSRDTTKARTCVHIENAGPHYQLRTGTFVLFYDRLGIK